MAAKEKGKRVLGTTLVGGIHHLTKSKESTLFPIFCFIFFFPSSCLQKEKRAALTVSMSEEFDNSPHFISQLSARL